MQNLHSTVWPAGTANDGCKKTENNWLSIQTEALNLLLEQEGQIFFIGINRCENLVEFGRILRKSGHKVVAAMLAHAALTLQSRLTPRYHPHVQIWTRRALWNRLRGFRMAVRQPMGDVATTPNFCINYTDCRRWPHLRNPLFWHGEGDRALALNVRGAWLIRA